MNNSAYRLLFLIATPKLADNAADMFLKRNLPVQFRFSGEGTASSEIMDTLGLGSTDKGILISMMPKTVADEMLFLLHSELRLDSMGSGIAFTVSLSGATNHMVRMMMNIEENSNDRKADMIMSESSYTLIAAIVDRGFSGDVMEAARKEGAGGGTVVHSRGIENEEATGFWGLSAIEEKEIVLILSPHDKKVRIMSAISEKCGMNSEAKGLVISLPTDTVMGL